MYFMLKKTFSAWKSCIRDKKAKARLSDIKGVEALEVLTKIKTSYWETYVVELYIGIMYQSTPTSAAESQDC